MSDITSKRGPRDPSEGLTNQGAATQSMLNDMSLEKKYQLQKRLNKKSTWDKIVGGIGDVLSIGRGVMDIANSYENLELKDEWIKQAEVNRQIKELQLEQNKQKLNMLSTQNSLLLQESKKGNEFLESFNAFEAAGDTDGLVRLSLSNPKQAREFQALLLNTANNLEANGNTTHADALRLAASTGNKTQQLNTLYGVKSDPNNSRAANPSEELEHKKYISYVEALTPLLKSTDNETKLAKLGLGESKNLPQDLLSCVTQISTSSTLDENKDAQEYAQSKALLDSSTNLVSKATNPTNKNVQYLDITCNVDGVPKTEHFVLNANEKVAVPRYTSKGLVSGDSFVNVGTALNALIARHNKYMNLTGKVKDQTPVVTSEIALKEQARRREDIVVDTPKRSLTEQEDRAGGKSYLSVSDVVSNNKNEVIDRQITAKQERLIKQRITESVNRIKDLDAPRNNVLKQLGFTEDDYKKLKGAQKINLLKDILLELAVRGKGLTEEEKNRIKENLKSKYNL